MDNPILAALLESVKSHPLISLLFGQKQMPAQGRQHTEIVPYAPTEMPYAKVSAVMNEGDDNLLHSQLLGIAKRPEGLCYYIGKGAGKTEDEAIETAGIGLEHKMLSNPADSARTDQVQKIFLEDVQRAFEMLQKNPQYLNKTIY